MVTYLSFEEYAQRTKQLGGAHWKAGMLAKRWDYHRKAVDILRALNLQSPTQVLEMGTMGVTLVNGSDTIDYTKGWSYQGKNPTYVHDARVLPWPIQAKRYKVFVALRVFQHLVPRQAECLREAMRIADHVIIVVPHSYSHRTLHNSHGMSYTELLKINDGAHPNRYLSTDLGDLYYWDVDQPSLTEKRSLSVRIRHRLSPIKSKLRRGAGLLARARAS
jgi:hypothetical protein